MVNLGLLDPFSQQNFSKVHGKVLMGSKMTSDIVAMLRHFFRVTTSKGGCGRETRCERLIAELSLEQRMCKLKMQCQVYESKIENQSYDID